MHTLRVLLLTTLFVPAALAQTWTPQTSGTANDLNNVFARSTTEVYVAGDNGTLLRTTNAGQTWTQLPVGGFDFEGVGFSPDGAVGIVATDDGPVLRSTDGVAWTLISTGSGDNLRDISWGTNSVVFSVGREGDALRSTDGGLTWSVSSIPNIERLDAISAVSATQAWVVGELGQIFVTTNGTTWTAQNSGTGADLSDVHMLDASTGYAVGSNNTILKTTNGGATWANVSNGNADGDGVFFVDASTGWVVDNGGLIWFTDNGGATWATQPSGVGANLSGVHFASPARGWAVGDAGAITAFTGPGGGVTVTVDPVNPPITIPAAGGSFQYTVTIMNTGAQAQTIDAWTAVTGPVNREPVARTRFNIGPGVTVTRTLTQQVPGVAPPGTYTFFVRVGTLGSVVLSEDSFPLTKAASLAGDAPAGAEAAWTGAFEEAAAGTTPAGFTLSEASPNPSRGAARLTLGVGEAQHVTAALYDALGRRVALLHDGALEAGTHALAFDGAGLPGGVYVVRVTGETFAATRRVTLVR
jgi:photosystem II stability/assembly factor-like uncharacterized protein